LSKIPKKDNFVRRDSARLAIMLSLIAEIIRIHFILLGQILTAFAKLIYPGKPKDVSEDIVLITGAGSGIGRMIALSFGKLGSIVVCCDINSVGNQQTVEEIEELGGKAFGYVFDCSDKEKVYETAEKIKKDVGDVTILINNAGVVTGKKFMDTPDELALKTFEVNTIAHFWTVKAFLPAMLEKDHGHIVSIASCAGLGGVRGLCDYCSSKFGAVGFQESLHMELKAMEKNIHTTVVCPYFINTGMFDGVQTRFPLLLPIMEPSYVVEQIMDAILHNKECLYLPRILHFAMILKVFLPYSSYVTVCDFLGFSTSLDHFVGRKKDN